MATRFEIEQRRRTIEELKLRGISNTMIAKMTQVARQTVISDIKWISAKNRKLASSDNKKQVIGDALAKFDRFQAMAIKEFQAVESGSPTRATFLSVAGKFEEIKLKLMQQVGMIPKDGKSLEDEWSLTDGVDPNEMTTEEIKKLTTRAILEITESLDIPPEKIMDQIKEAVPDTDINLDDIS